MRIRERVARLLHGLTPGPPPPVTSLHPGAARRGARGRARWLVVLGAAAALALIAATPVVVRALANRGATTSVAAPTGSGSHAPSAISSPAPTGSVRVGPLPSGWATPGPDTASPFPLGAAVTGTLRAGGAVLPLPAGWVARVLPAGWFGSPSTATPPASWPTWCLAPATAPRAWACTVLLRAVPTSPPPGAQFSVNAVQGWVPQAGAPAAPCLSLPGSYTEKLTGYRDVTFGGREASYRAWTDTCPGGPAAWTAHVVQYVVPTAPAFVLYTDHADTATTSAMATLARTARLPAQAAPLPYTFTGMVTAAQPEGTGMKITVAPWVRLPSLDGWVPVPGGHAQTFLIPAALVPTNGTDYHAYGVVTIVTDGHTVTQLTLTGG